MSYNKSDIYMRQFPANALRFNPRKDPSAYVRNPFAISMLHQKIVKEIYQIALATTL